MAYFYLKVVAVGLLALIAYAVAFVGRRGKNFPPGPPTLPIIGNLHQLPLEKVWFKFNDWSKEYGGLYTVKLGPNTAVVITDRRIARQLLDKRSAISANRPNLEVGQKIITEGDHLLWMQATPSWRLMRRLIHADFTESMCIKEHSKIQQAETTQMLYDMLHTPDQWKRHISRFSNSVILSIVYGIRSPNVDSPYVRRIEELLEIWARINAFGATPPIDIFPFLKWVPQSAFNNWVDRARKVHDEMHTLYNGLREAVLQRRKKHGSQNSMIDRLLDQQQEAGLTEHQVTLLAGVTLKGGSDTSAVLLAAFMQAMVTFPEVQKKAQAEIDSVIPEDRVPDLSDYARLPYVAATVKESHRWRPVAPLSVPHALTEDEWIDGYFLPKGTALFLNVWGLHQDEKRFPNPDVFDPDHYKGKLELAAEYANAADPELRDHYGYGNGRRICPGIHLADRNLFHAISKILWAFNIEMATDPTTGKTIVPDTNYATGYREGLTACALPFPVKLTVRSETRRKAIEAAFADAQANDFPQYEKTDFI